MGSINLITDAAGKVVAELDYDPWGMRRKPSTQDIYFDADLIKASSIFSKPITTRGFTGHEMIDDNRLIHMNGRVYDPKIARFVQADPIIQDPYKSQSLNRYSYVWNNPLNAIDPSGFQTCPKEGSDNDAGCQDDGHDWDYEKMATQRNEDLVSSGYYEHNGNWGGVTAVVSEEYAISNTGIAPAAFGARVGSSSMNDPSGTLAAGFGVGGLMSGPMFAIPLALVESTKKDVFKIAYQRVTAQKGSRVLSYDEYLQEIEDGGARIGRVSRADRRLANSLMSGEAFQTEAKKIYGEAVSSGRERQGIRIYRVSGENGKISHYSLHPYTGSPCSNGSSTCMVPPPIVSFDSWELVLSWHPHPNGTSLPSSSDYISNSLNGSIGTLWYGEGQVTIYRGERR